MYKKQKRNQTVVSVKVGEISSIVNVRDHFSFIWYLINSTIVGHSTIKSECVARHSVVCSFYFFHLIDYMQHMIVLLWIHFKCYLFISEYIKTLLFIDGFHLEVRTRGQCTLYNIEYYIHTFSSSLNLCFFSFVVFALFPTQSDLILI